MFFDLVYTWVDGSDDCWRKKRDQFKVLPNNRITRWIDQNELRYSLRSVYLYAPWIRNIYIVTDGQVPEWLNIKHPQIHLVEHQEIFCWPEDLPTFNSHAIECHLHRIPGLSSHFLYANDDMFFGCQTCPEDFFTLDGKMVIGAGGTLLPKQNIFPPAFISGGVGPAIFKAVELLSELYPGCRHLYPIHQIKPYTRELFLFAEERWPQIFRSCSRNRFRGEGDVSLNFALLHPLALKMRKGVLTRIRELFLAPRNQHDLLLHQDILSENMFKLICVNSDSDNALSLDSLFRNLWPNPCPFEI